jgi:hypothetical protein
VKVYPLLHQEYPCYEFGSCRGGGEMSSILQKPQVKLGVQEGEREKGGGDVEARNHYY